MENMLEIVGAAIMGAELQHYFHTSKAVQAMSKMPLLLNSFKIYKQAKHDRC